MSEPALLDLVHRCGLDAAGPVRLERLGAGGNNRLYRVEGASEPCVLKHYFRHPSQPRDRLDAEFGFLTHAWARGVRSVPRPIARDDAAGLGLLAFVPGRRLAPDEVGRAEVLEALAFVREVNAPARREAAGLGPAAEACFSVAEHLDVVDGRVARLRALAPSDELGAEAARFVARELDPAWQEIRAAVARRIGHVPAAWARTVDAANRIVSPSDFGFHNALRREDGRLAFLDFEYAGWDDPAKLACDFSFQGAVPAPPEHFDAFAGGLAALVPDAAGTLARIHLLRPVLGVKWVCILLNHFTRVDLARRLFADAAAATARALQLAKARDLLARLARAERA